MSDSLLDANELASEISKAMSHGRTKNGSLFLTTGVTYTNGVGVTVRIDEGRDGLVVSDDGYAAVIAEGMGAFPAFNRIAAGVAQRSGVIFGRGSFIVSDINKSSLAVAVNLVSNASARAIERLAASLEQPKIRRSKELFEKKLRGAFGNAVSFDLDFLGATGRQWQFNAGVTEGGAVVRLFELVSPSTQSVAIANLKISDAQALVFPPRITAALSDYDATDPTLRAILSASGSIVISANDDISKYRLSAA